MDAFRAVDFSTDQLVTTQGSCISILRKKCFPAQRTRNEGTQIKVCLQPEGKAQL